VVETPFTTSSLSFFDISKHRVESSIVVSAKEGMVADRNTFLSGPFKLMLIDSENRMGA